MPRLAVAFFCSGFAALLCQIVWQRMLGIFAGSDTISAALVVGAFLAGLGLGSIIGAKVADRLSPYRAMIGFALAEGGVAVFALVSKFFLYDFLATDLAGVVDNPVAIFALCFAGLVLPTTLMGASLPLLARAIATNLETVAERIGTLYGLNTLGAGLGALLGGWLLVGNLGFVGALMLAAGLDILAALLALTLLPALKGAAVPQPAPKQAGAAGQTEPFGSLKLWCVLVFLSGYVIVALEIVWVRLMGQVGQYHAYLFPTVLGVFLLADGLGMALAARMVRKMKDPRPAFFITQAAGFALGAALIMALYWALPHWPISNYVSTDIQRLRDGGLAFLPHRHDLPLRAARGAAGFGLGRRAGRLGAVGEYPRQCGGLDRDGHRHLPPARYRRHAAAAGRPFGAADAVLALEGRLGPQAGTGPRRRLRPGAGGAARQCRALGPAAS
jgi:MFS family permease